MQPAQLVRTVPQGIEPELAIEGEEFGRVGSATALLGLPVNPSPNRACTFQRTRLSRSPCLRLLAATFPAVPS